jgi:hypothetical protein
MGRRNAYLRAGDWLSDLRRLTEAGCSDRQVAAALSQRLGRPVTERHVRYWRWQLYPRKHRREKDRQRRREAAAMYQIDQGWIHLLPHGLRWPLTGEGPGHRLRPRECDILSALRDHGSMTARQLRQRLGRRSLQNGPAYLLAGLCRQGLVELRGYITVAPHRHEATYALADAARASARPRQDTGIERRYG